ncbi:putative tail tubular protein B [Acinetobacter phage phiAB1]|uniref:Putative tail tubular protein B n=1 Tax=Acinetobacter phage phiAB1 TaxID=691318 RepID=E5KJQ2_9CAUD|nr:tail protein [Acinetobacter phage phiAB1]ADQ12741.1 putative tail tubular protein B [Acinetobacter phage phiAB1]
MILEGVYPSFLKGVSQQTPQERSDGQLGAQLNLLSDAVTGLRRRGGVKFQAKLTGIPNSSYIRLIDINGVNYIMIVDTVTGTLKIYNFDGSLLKAHQTDYLKASNGKASIRSTVSRNNCFVLNTEQVITKTPTGGTNPIPNPSTMGYISIRSGQFSKMYSVDIKSGSYTLSFGVGTSGSEAWQATPEWVATEMENRIKEDTTLNARYTVVREGSTVALKAKSAIDTNLLVIESGTGSTYIQTSNSSRVQGKQDIIANLPNILDKYIIAVGTVGNSAYYQYNATTSTWKECGVYEAPYKFTNEPIYWYFDDTDTIQVKSLDIQPRTAGDDDNNPLPKFVDFGITGISAYQSRLVLLSGSYVNMSATADFNVYMRTTVEELQDDDPIEVSSTALSAAQFEYAVPYNKDLVLLAQNQQAVIPANSTVLTPKTAVIYPSSKANISMASEPQVVSRSLYYTYQRGTDYYQVGEMIPNAYSDAQYYAQNLADHIPLYATGVCTSITGSTTDNMAVFSSDQKELLVHQYLWAGEDRPLMSFHKWELPYDVLHVQFLQEYLVLFMDVGDDLVVGTINVQLNQLDNKPIPFLDIYQYVDIVDGEGTLPEFLPAGELVAAVYSSETMRHAKVQYEIEGTKIKCQFNGRIYLGVPYESSLTLTPPFVKDDKGRVVAGSNSTVIDLTMTFKSTGEFEYHVSDTYGDVFDGETSAQAWSETQLGYTRVNTVSDVKFPCGTLLSSTEFSIRTKGTTELNIISASYNIRVPNRGRRRL